jgi:hypothetical protein
MKKAIGIVLAALMIGTTFFAVVPFTVSAQANVPVWQVGDGWYFGKTWDFSEMQEKIDQELNSAIGEYPGFEANVDVAGGVGLYLGAEVVADDVSVNGYDCYHVQLTGALGVDFGLDATIQGSMTNEYMDINIDAEAHATATGEATLDGNFYFTVDEMAFAKADITFNMDADIQAQITADIQMSASYGEYNQDIDANIDGDISVVVNGAQVTGAIECDPPIDIFDFPIYEGDYWAVPDADTDVTASLTGAGTIAIDAVITGISGIDPSAEDVDEHQTINLADEIGSQSGSDTIFYGTTWFECIASDGTNYIIETDTGALIDYIDFPGTRQFGIDPTDLIGDAMPSAGLQYNEDEGFVTGMSMDGEVETAATDKATVENFATDPQGQVTSETGGAGGVGGASGGGSLLAIILILVIVIVVVFVVLAMVLRRKKGPEQMYGAPPPGQQPYYPQQQQYQQPPPQQQPPQGQYPPPPPPQSGY